MKCIQVIGILFMFSCSCAYLCISWCIEVILNLFTNRFVSTTKISMKYVVNWISLRMCVRQRNTQPHLKGGPEPLGKESYEFLGSKRDDQFPNPFFEMVPKKCQGSFFVPVLA